MTREQYGNVMGGGHKSLFAGLRHPVDNVSMQDAALCVLALTAKFEEEGTLPAGAKFELPEEVVWEYAARAGSQTAYFFGSDPEQLTHYAWFDGIEGTHEVGKKLPNPWGLYDMYGNVAEICLGAMTERGYYKKHRSSKLHPIVRPSSGRSSTIPLRGGAWNFRAHRCRSAARQAVYGTPRYPFAGFRVVRHLGENEVPPTPPIDISTIHRYKPKEFPWDEFRKEL